MAEDVMGPQHFLASRNAEIYPAYRERLRAKCALEAMDIEGIDVAIMFRTFAHMVVRSTTSSPISRLPFAVPSTIGSTIARPIRRLKPAAIVSRTSPTALQEARRAVQEKGHVAIVLLPMPVKGRYLNAPECDVSGSTIERLDVPLAFHGTSGGDSKDFVANRFPDTRTTGRSITRRSFPLELMLALGTMTAGGVLERFPHFGSPSWRATAPGCRGGCTAWTINGRSTEAA